MCKIQLKPRICIIDKDAEVIAILTSLLRLRDIEVSSYGSTRALKDNEILSNIACLLLEVNLHDKDSLAFLEELNKSALSIPTIVISSESDIAMAVSVMKNNAIDLIEKPIIYNLLVKQLDSIVRQSASVLPRTKSDHTSRSKPSA